MCACKSHENKNVKIEKFTIIHHSKTFIMQNMLVVTAAVGSFFYEGHDDPKTFFLSVKPGDSSEELVSTVVEKLYRVFRPEDLSFGNGFVGIIHDLDPQGGLIREIEQKFKERLGRDEITVQVNG
ncbi:MAG: hypothetical protein JWM20_850 [Patescibacteria group bacterium]|nr:hypothetical protein [Patescibacteria group bacterium]